MNSCQICQKSYEKLGHLSTHIHQKHDLTYKDYYDRYIKSDIDGFCKICGKITQFYKGKYSNYCSIQCQNSDPETKKKNSESVIRAKAKRTVEQIENENKTRQQTVFDNYGVDNVSQLDAIKEKVEKTFKNHYGGWYLNTKECKDAFKDKFGVENVLQVPEFLEKVQRTNMVKYGFITPAKNDDVKKKISQTKINKTYWKFLQFSQIEPLFKLEDYTGKNILKMYDWKCKKCQHVFQYKYHNGIIPICPKCYPPRKQTELKVYEFLNQIYRREIIRNSRKLFGTEFDFYLPEKKIVIEFNGLYWHTEISGTKDRNYHLKKTNIAEQNTLKLIHIFEDEWIFKNHIVKTRLKHILGEVKYNIFARKCIIKEVESQVKNTFLNKYHIQGEDKSAINFGCYYKNRLVAVMTFSKLRKALGQTHKVGSWELSRYATIANFNIIGGAGKLLKHFERTYSPLKVITYADRRWSQGNLYNQLGFKLDHISTPNYWYVPYGGRRRLHRFNFRKNELEKKLKTYNAELSEWQNMQLNGYDRIWDCGNLVFCKNYLVSP